MKTDVSNLEVMPVCCKTCPFKLDENDMFQNIELANKVIERTLFKATQICHFSNYDKKKQQFKCRGSYDYNMEIYKRMGINDK